MTRNLWIGAVCFILGGITAALAATGALRPDQFIAMPWTWSGIQSFNDGKFVLNGSSSGSSIVKAPASGGGTATLPTGTGTLVFSAGAGTVTSVTCGTGLTGGTITSTGTCAVDATTLATGTSVSLTAPREYYVCTGTCTVTPPVPAAGDEFCVMNDDNVATVITLAALGSSARYETTARTAYGTAGTGTMVSGGAVGDKVCIVGRDSTHYLTTTFTGTWTVN